MTPDLIATWERDGADGSWDRLRRPLSAAIGLGALFLLYTQPELFNWTVATV